MDKNFDIENAFYSLLAKVQKSFNKKDLDNGINRIIITFAKRFGTSDHILNTPEIELVEELKDCVNHECSVNSSFKTITDSFTDEEFAFLHAIILQTMFELSQG